MKAPEDRVLLLESVVACVIALSRLEPDEEEMALKVGRSEVARPPILPMVNFANRIMLGPAAEAPLT